MKKKKFMNNFKGKKGSRLKLILRKKFMTIYNNYPYIICNIYHFFIHIAYFFKDNKIFLCWNGWSVLNVMLCKTTIILLLVMGDLLISKT